MKIVDFLMVIFSSILVSVVLNKILLEKYYDNSKSRTIIRLSIIVAVFLSIWCTYSTNVIESIVYQQTLYRLTIGMLLGVLSSSFMIDIYYKELPDENNFMIGVLTLLLSFGTYGYKTILTSVILFVVFFIVSIITGQFGMGDVKIMFFMGLGFLPNKIFTFLFNTFFLAIIYAIIQTVLKRNKVKSLPLGPFLIMSFLKIMF